MFNLAILNIIIKDDVATLPTLLQIMSHYNESLLMTIRINIYISYLDWSGDKSDKSGLIRDIVTAGKCLTYYTSFSRFSCIYKHS